MEPRHFGGRYELGEVLGHGGMAEVRIGIDRRLGRTVAIKILRSDLATDPTFQARFRREAQSAAALNHPAIVAVYDTGEEVIDGVGVPYIVMEYVEGRTLRDVLREGRRILPERAMEISADVLEALEYSHRAGIVHRDIKPGNVMLTPSGDVKVMDFGIARALADASATMTQTAAVIGTAQYLSPEQARGESVDARSDIYSTGCLLYELLTGRPPFVGDSPVSVAYQHVREEPRPPSMLDPEVTPEADAITLKALQKKPLDRYQTADEMRGDIVRALSGQRVAAPVGPPPDATQAFMPAGEPGPPYPPDDQWQREEGPDKGRRWAYVLLTIAIVFVVAVVGFLLWQMLGSQGVTVPDLQGKTQAEAKALLEQNELQLGATNSVASETIPKGQIVKQDPAANASAEKGKAVAIWVSAGKPDIAIPQGLIGKSRTAAEDELRRAGFNDIQQKPDKNSDKPKDSVTDINPAEGTRAARDQKIVLTYSMGYPEVPDVRTENVDDAKETLEKEGFKVKVVQKANPAGDEDPGTVWTQSPKAGTRHPKNTRVIITVQPDEEKPDFTARLDNLPQQIRAGEQFQFQLVVQNVGEGDGRENPQVTVTFPQGTTVDSPPRGCTGAFPTFTCTLNPIPQDNEIRVDFNGTVNGDVVAGTRLNISAQVSSQEEENTGNNGAQGQMEVVLQ